MEAEKIVELVKNIVGENAEIVFPQFQRTEKLQFKYIPDSEEKFLGIIQKAPWEILFGMGFSKWSTMNNLISKNNEYKAKHKIEIPILNKEDISPIDEIESDGKINNGRLIIEVGKEESCPSELLEIDEDVVLFPGEWYNAIPDGFMVTGLFGESYPFKKDESDDDIRFGCLPYGFRRKINQKNFVETAVIEGKE
jgi:hypothetical protein